MDASNAVNYCKNGASYDKSKCMRGCFWYSQGDYTGGVWNTIDNVATQSTGTDCYVTSWPSRIAFCKQGPPRSPNPSGAETCKGKFAKDKMCTDPSITDCAGTYVDLGSGTYAQCGLMGSNCLAVGPFCR
mmetsp:Transcript_101311/g.180064  ORF Transcript_101311/g.180064 Transcript_101311/m.180064 type:complete len:130 (+) Transcript_101311:338-727(+)